MVSSSFISLSSFSLSEAQNYSQAVEFLNEYAIKLYKNGDPQSAVIEFRKVLILDPDNKLARSYLGELQRRFSLGEPLSPKRYAPDPSAAVREQASYVAVPSAPAVPASSVSYPREQSLSEGMQVNQARITELESKVALYQQKIQELQAALLRSSSPRREVLVKDQEKVRSRKADLDDKESQKFTRELSELRKKASSCREKILSVETKIQALNMKDPSGKRARKLRSQLSKLNGELAGYESRISAIEERLSRLSESGSDIAVSVDAQEQIKELNDKLQQSHKEVELLLERNKALEEYNRRISLMENGAEKGKVVNDVLQAGLPALKEGIQDGRETTAQMSSLLDENNKKIRSLQDKLAEKESGLRALTDELKLIQENAPKSEMAKKISELEGLLKTKETAAAKLEAEKKKLEADLKKETDKYKENLKRVERELAESKMVSALVQAEGVKNADPKALLKQKEAAIIKLQEEKLALAEKFLGRISFYKKQIEGLKRQAAAESPSSIAAEEALKSAEQDRRISLLRQALMKEVRSRRQREKIVLENELLLQNKIVEMSAGYKELLEKFNRYNEETISRLAEMEKSQLRVKDFSPELADKDRELAVLKDNLARSSAEKEKIEKDALAREMGLQNKITAGAVEKKALVDKYSRDTQEALDKLNELSSLLELKEAEIKEFKRIIDETIAEKNKLAASGNQRSAQEEALRKSLADKDSQIKGLGERKSALESEISRLKSEIEKYSSRETGLAELNNEVSRKSGEIESLKKEARLREDEIKKLKHLKETYSNTDQHDKIRSLVSSQEEQIADLLRKLSLKEEELNKLNARLFSGDFGMEKENQALKERLKDAEGRLSALNGEISRLKSQPAVVEKINIEPIKEELKSQENKISLLLTQIKDKDSLISGLKDDIRGKEEEISNLQAGSSAVSLADKDIQELARVSEQKIRLLLNTIKDKSDEIAALKRSNEEISSRLSGGRGGDGEASLSRLKNDLEDSRRQNQELQLKINQLRQDFEKLSSLPLKDSTQVTDEVMELRSQLKQYKERIAVLEQEMRGRAETEKRLLETQLELQNKIVAIKEENLALLDRQGKNTDDALARFGEFEKVIAERQSEIERMKKILSDSIKAYEAKSKESTESYEKEIKALRSEIHKKDKDIAGLKKRPGSSAAADASSSEIEDLRSRVSGLLEEIDKKNRDISSLGDEAGKKDVRINELQGSNTRLKEDFARESREYSDKIRILEDELKAANLLKSSDEAVKADEQASVVAEDYSSSTLDPKMLEKMVQAREKVIDIFKKARINDFDVELISNMLVINLQEMVIFDAGKARVRPSSYSFLSRLAKLMNEDFPEAKIRIEGYTDNQPIRASLWPSNWELSSARALAVLHYLSDNFGVKEERLSAVGMGENEPLSSNDTAEGRRKNRRVAIKIIPE